VEPAGIVKETAAGSWGGTMFVVDDNYERSLDLRAEILERDPARFTTLPHMMPAQWDAMLYSMKRLAAEHPDVFSLDRHGEFWTWQNHRTDLVQTFRYGDAASLPFEPIEFIARQVQEDFLVMEVRDQQVQLDLVLVTFSAGWSPSFATGMNFQELHGVLPRVMKDGTVNRAEKFLATLEHEQTYRRNAWAFQVGAGLDRSRDALPEWAAESAAMLASLNSADLEQVGRTLFLRSELSHFVRLPLTDAILYTIRPQIISLEDLASVPEWAQRVVDVIEEQPEDLARFRGLNVFGPHVLRYLKSRLASVD